MGKIKSSNAKANIIKFVAKIVKADTVQRKLAKLWLKGKKSRMVLKI